MLQQRALPPQNGQTDKGPAGVLASVDMIDFMCHSHLHVDLASMSNVITGQNGSKWCEYERIREAFGSLTATL